jgi:hypothetical protein
MRFQGFAIAVIVSLLLAWQAIPAGAQSLTSGAITGVVTDPSNAVIPNATVTLKNNATGATQTATTNAQGSYRFSLLGPGTYTISANATGFQGTQELVEVNVGQTTTLGIQLPLGTATQTVEVSATGGVIETENANISTTVGSEQISTVPNPGNDLSYYLQIAPGSTMNTQAGYGNCAVNGISGTSNLYTVNGMNENDPFLNLNNSGATNILLGANDIQEATVVNNGYSGQYGTLPEPT